MKRPILTSDLPFAKFVRKVMLFFFDPLNPEEIANQIENLVNNDHLYDELVKKWFEASKRIYDVGTEGRGLYFNT